MHVRTAVQHQLGRAAAFTYQASAIGGQMNLKSGLTECLYSVVLQQVCLPPLRTGLDGTASVFNVKHLGTP